MRRIITFALALIITISAFGGRVTINVTNQAADKVFAEIMRQSGKNFVYTSGLLDGLWVTLHVSSQPLDKVLDTMFDGTDIVWRNHGNNILLSRRKSKIVKIVNISGFVRESGTGEPLAGVTVAASDFKTGTTTNSLGYFTITVPRDTGTISFSLTSFRTVEIPLGTRDRKVNIELEPLADMLQEVTIYGNPARSNALDASAIGTLTINRDAIQATPVIFGESDAIKTLQFEPGISAGVEGMAGMYVHGGNVDENKYMLDNIPLYQVNHFGGLFSAFNTEAIRSVDFYKTSFPARYDGRLSSFVDVRTKDGSLDRHRGSVRLGLTSGALAIDGPLSGGRTTYSVALRRSWFDLLTIPAFAIINSMTTDGESVNPRYSFTDLNAKITHRFAEGNEANVLVYYGEDRLKVTQKWESEDKATGDFDKVSTSLHWGNLLVSAGWHKTIGHNLFAEFTGAYTRYSSRLSHSEKYEYRKDSQTESYLEDCTTSDNHIHDVIVKADFNWQPQASHSFDFGAALTHHTFLPARTSRAIRSDSLTVSGKDQITKYSATEANLYAGGDWTPHSAFRINYGTHLTLFGIDGKTHANLSPRLSVRLTPAHDWAIKAGYSRTVQYVHQILQSAISLPTDQWVPIVGDQKPQTADKIAAAVCYSNSVGFTLSTEVYWKWMRNLLDYADDWYLLPPETDWHDKLTSGKGTSKGLDFKISKDFGRITGHVAYTLLWADRCYPNRNHGKSFQTRFDNRHKINVLVNWRINDRWEINAAWTGMSGNRFTLVTQVWVDPGLGPWHYDMLLETEMNNYRLPFYHRLDLSVRRHTHRGYWDFSLYNAYCNMNTIAVVRDYSDNYQTDMVTGSIYNQPTFQKIKLIPIIPSVSYTWLF